MTRLKQAIAACILAIALLPAVPAQAATYYVATTGNNSNPGTSASPWRTVAYAVSKMVAGDTTYVNGGTYSEGIITFARPGTQSAPIRLLNRPGQFPIINFLSFADGHSIRIQNITGYKNAIGWIAIEGFELRNGREGIKIYNGHDITIRRNWIHHNGHGILGNGIRVLIDRNRINHNGQFAKCVTDPSTCTKDHGIYANGSAFTISNNLIYDNLAYGITLNGSVAYDSTRHAGPEYASSNNWVIANNTFAYQANRAGIVVWGSRCANARIENNIFYENFVKGASYHENGISFTSASGSTGIVIRNNLAFASGSGGTKFLGAGGSYTESGNIVNTLNPGFVNAPATLPSAPNFALTSGSPAINKGLTHSATKTSYTNVSRPQQSLYDIGAFEFLNSSTSLAAPTSLQLVN